MKVTMKIQTVSLLNKREHFRVTAKRKSEQREYVAAFFHNCKRPPLPCTITLTRVSAGTLDAHDNLPSAFKHIVDQIAAWLGVDDADPRVTWIYAQEKCKRGDYGVEVEIS